MWLICTIINCVRFQFLIYHQQEYPQNTPSSSELETVQSHSVLQRQEGKWTVVTWRGIN